MRRPVLRTWLRIRAGGERGASLVEYVLLVSFIAITVLAAVGFFGDQVDAQYSGAGSTLNSAMNP